MNKNEKAVAVRKPEHIVKADPYDWVPGKIGTDFQPIVNHVVLQVQRMQLEEDAGFNEIMRAMLEAQARIAAIHGDFASLVDDHMPIDVSSLPAEVPTSPYPQSDEEYNHWRDRRAETALDLIGRGMDFLKKFPLNDFWDEILWKRLKYSHSDEIIMHDGLALLEVVLRNVPESEQEIAIATALASRFAEDIVKAEINEDNTLITSGTLGPRRTKELDELREILSLLLVATEGTGYKLYKDTLPVSRSWGGKLIREVAGGNDALLADFRNIINICKPALKGEDVRWSANVAIAQVLAKHFPSIIISKLTPSTEIVLRTYQVKSEPDESGADSAQVSRKKLPAQSGRQRRK